MSYRFTSRPEGGVLPIYISVESIPPCRVMWTRHGIETSIPTTRKDRSPHHTPLCTTIEDWTHFGWGILKQSGWFDALIIIPLKSSKGLIPPMRLLNHSDSLWSKRGHIFTKKEREFLNLHWKVIFVGILLPHTVSTLFLAGATLTNFAKTDCSVNLLMKQCAGRA